MTSCPVCRSALTWIPQYGAWYCYPCQKYHRPEGITPPAASVPSGPQQLAVAQAAASSLWFQNFYRIRKKVIAVANQYAVEDWNGQLLAYSRQKMFRIKEDIRVYTDKGMGTELFRIRQTNWTNAWGDFAVVDSASGQTVGSVRRKALMSAFRDEWEIYDAWGRLVGGIYQSGGSAMLQRLVTNLAPETLQVTLNGQPVATIHQQFKPIGDVWEVTCTAVPSYFDRRTLLACALLMGMIERDRK